MKCTLGLSVLDPFSGPNDSISTMSFLFFSARASRIELAANTVTLFVSDIAAGVQKARVQNIASNRLLGGCLQI